MAKLKICADAVLDYCEYIKCQKVNSNYFRMELTTDDKDNMPYACHNMQEDCAAFEAIAFCIWSELQDCVIEFDWQIGKLNWDKKYIDFTKRTGNVIRAKKKDRHLPEEKMDSLTCHYLRFLYRVSKMMKLFPQKFVIVNQERLAEISKFNDIYSSALYSQKLMLTTPGSNSGIANIKAKSNDGLENWLEKWFVIKWSNTDIAKLTKVSMVYDQFPCGLFYLPGKVSKPHEDNRIFNEGFFDLCGVDEDNNFCVFELKQKGNAKLGILSELFFYVCLSCDMLTIKKYILEKMCPSHKANIDNRGFKKFLEANDVVKGYFLAPQYHSFIEKRIDVLEKLLNRTNNMCFKFLKFDQDKIDLNGISVTENGFANKKFRIELEKDWNNRN